MTVTEIYPSLLTLAGFAAGLAAWAYAMYKDPIVDAPLPWLCAAILAAAALEGMHLAAAAHLLTAGIVCFSILYVVTATVRTRPPRSYWLPPLVAAVVLTSWYAFLIVREHRAAEARAAGLR